MEKDDPVQGNATTTEALARLEAAQAILREFGERSEAGFLQLGERLRNVARGSRRLAECAGELAGEGGVTRYRRAIVDFEALVEELRGLRGGTASQGEVLRRIACLARAFRAPAREFARANRTFRLLGLYVRVEASRLKDDGAEFGSLADDMAALALGIDESAERLESDARLAAETMEQGWERIESLSREQSAESAEMLELAAGEIAALSGRRAEAETAARTLAKGCERLRDEVSSVVRSLQFQDIARQRLEHVCEGLDRLREELRNGRARAGVRLAALEARQLDSARQELEAALERIGASLQEAGRQAAGFHEQAGRLGAEGNGMTACAEGMTVAGHACSGSVERLGQVVAEVLPVLGAMGDSAARIDETGYRIGMVALNCAVKTAWLGGEGAALGVVAGEMGRLAMATGQQAEAATARLEDLRRETSVLSELGLVRSGRGLEARVRDALTRAAEAEQAERERVEAVLAGSSRLMSDLSGRDEDRDWSKQLLERLEEAGRHLAGLERELEGQAGVEGEAGEECGQSMEGRYTMASEREIHQEYFSANTPQENPSKANEDATFDDGIELF